MTEQRLNGKKIRPLAGVALILGFVASIILVSWIERAIAISTGFQYGQFAVWIIVAAEVFMIMRLNARGYRYCLKDGAFTVEALYGQRVRPLFSIPVGQIIAFGERDSVFRQYGNAQGFDKAIVRDCPLAPMAIAWKKPDIAQPALLVIQPDESMRAALEAAVGQPKTPPPEAPAENPSEKTPV